MTATLLQQALPTFHCPHCQQQGQLELDHEAVQCRQCKRTYPVHDGVVDFIPEWNVKSKFGSAQRLMEHPKVAAIYEDHWRPFITSIGSSFTYDDEQRWLQSKDASRGHKIALDLATGTGRYARLLADIHQPEWVLAVDISLPMLKIAQKKTQDMGYKNILFVRGDAHQLPLATCSIDRINCFGAMHLFPDASRALAELGRVAKPDAVFTCLTAATVPSGLKRKMQQVFSRWADFQFFEQDLLQEWLARAGYRNITFEQFGMLLLFSAHRASMQQEKIDDNRVADVRL